MKITIIGGGNIGTLMAAEFAIKGHEVTIYTSKPERWKKVITIVDANHEEVGKGELSNITSDLKEAVSGANMIWVTFPAQMFAELGKQLEQYIEPGQLIGVVPGAGGVEFAFAGLIKKGAILFGLQRVHSIARLEKYGEIAGMLGRKPRLELGTIPAAKSAEIAQIVEGLFDIPTKALPNYLCVTLTPSNPILHTTRLYSMFKDYKAGVVYPKNFLFYEEWSMLAAEMLIACDAELQALCERIPLELEDVVSLKEYYESPTPEAMVDKISHIKAFKGLTSPMVEIPGGWGPDFQSRYFSTDFPYGLKIIRDLADLFDIDTPNIDIVWAWYEKFDPEHAKTGIDIAFTREELVKLYK